VCRRLIIGYAVLIRLACVCVCVYIKHVCVCLHKRRTTCKTLRASSSWNRLRSSMNCMESDISTTFNLMMAHTSYQRLQPWDSGMIWTATDVRPIYTERKRERERERERESVCVCACDSSSGMRCSYVLLVFVCIYVYIKYVCVCLRLIIGYTMLICLACAAIGPPTPRVPCRASRQTYTARRWSTGWRMTRA